MRYPGHVSRGDEVDVMPSHVYQVDQITNIGILWMLRRTMYVVPQVHHIQLALFVVKTAH
jgi:hypothetical protein